MSSIERWGLAYEFYKKYPRETLIVVTSDHETGGLGFTLALKDLSSTRGPNQVAATIDDLKKLDSIPISLKKASGILGPTSHRRSHRQPHERVF